jgi:hypothetical protein
MKGSFGTVPFSRVKDVDEWNVTWNDETNANVSIGNNILFKINSVSWLPGNNLGLFSNVEFEPTKILGFYHGIQVPESDLENLSKDEISNKCKYLLEISKPKIINMDAFPILEKCPFAYMNDPRGHTEEQNAYFTTSGYVRALKKINIGDEILIDYGQNYEFC